MFVDDWHAKRKLSIQWYWPVSKCAFSMVCWKKAWLQWRVIFKALTKITIPICAMILKFLILSAGILVKSISFVGSADLSFWCNVSSKVLFIEKCSSRICNVPPLIYFANAFVYFFEYIAAVVSLPTIAYSVHTANAWKEVKSKISPNCHNPATGGFWTASIPILPLRNWKCQNLKLGVLIQHRNDW